MMSAAVQPKNPTGKSPGTRRRRAPWRGIFGQLAVVLVLTAVAAGPCEAGALLVSIDTSTLAGVDGRFEFTLLDGDFTANNSVTISNLATDGALLTTECSIGCLPGGPPPSFTIEDALGLGQFLQDLKLGSVFSFDLAFSTNFSGQSAPDRFALNLLFGTNFTAVDTDLDFLDDPVPAQDALLLVDLVGNGVVDVATISNPTTPVAAVPEPGTAALVALSMLALVASRLRAARRLVFFR